MYQLAFGQVCVAVTFAFTLLAATMIWAKITTSKKSSVAFMLFFGCFPNEDWLTNCFNWNKVLLCEQDFVEYSLSTKIYNDNKQLVFRLEAHNYACPTTHMSIHPRRIIYQLFSLSVVSKHMYSIYTCGYNSIVKLI